MTSLALARPDHLAGEVDELARLYEAHAEWLEGYCARRLGSRVDAEDAVQTTFLYALRALRRGVVPECEEAWLTTIARNVCLTQRRTHARRGSLGSVDLEGVAGATADPDESLLVSELPGVLRSLPETQRQALLMREWRGLDATEIGSRLGLSTTATHALLTRARRSFVGALTSAVGRPLSALNVAFLLETLRAQLKALAGGASAKAAVGVTVAGMAVGGAVVGQSLHEPSKPAPAPPVVRAADRSLGRPAAPAALPLARGAGRAAPLSSGGAIVPDAGRPQAVTGAVVPTGETGSGTPTSGPALPPTREEPAAPVEPPASPPPPSSEVPTPVAPPPPELPRPELPPIEVPPPPEPELPVDGPVPPLPPLPAAPPLPPAPPLPSLTVPAP